MTYKKVSYDDAVHNKIYNNYVSKRIVIVLPSHNEEDSIGQTLQSIVNLKKPEGIILDVFIGLDNCSDGTEDVVRKFSDSLNIYTMETVNNKERKVGNLNQLYRLFFGDLSKKVDNPAPQHSLVVDNIVAFLGIDADVYLEKNSLMTLYEELESDYRIGAVSANYTCTRDAKNLLGKFLTGLQSKDFASWTIKQKVDNYHAQINGGQMSLFRAEALKDLFDNSHLNGIYNGDTATEDLELTQRLREYGWKTVISKNARCYVDSMKNMRSLYSQRKKWFGGKLDYMTSALSHDSIVMWGQELLLWSNIILRLSVAVLIGLSLWLDMFKWNWFWIIPLLLAAILNCVVTIKTPYHTFIETLFSLTGIPTEFWLWFEFRVHLSVWKDKFSANKKDLWLAQEQAENGISSSRDFTGIFALLTFSMAIVLLYTSGLVTVAYTVSLIKPYITVGFMFTNILTLITTLLMLKELFKFRSNQKA